MRRFNLPIVSEGSFVELCIDVLNNKYQDATFHEFGKKGQKQGGIDLISFNTEIVAQCKWKDVNLPADKKRETLIKEITKDYNRVLKARKFKSRKIIFMSTHYNDAAIQTYCKQLSKKGKLLVEYWGWATIEKEIQDSDLVLKKYYPNTGSLEDLSGEIVNEINKHFFEVHRGAILMSPGKTAIFGNDGYGTEGIVLKPGNLLARAEVTKMRRKLKRLGIKELMFKLSSDSGTWVLVVESERAQFLNDAIWNCYPEGSSNNDHQKQIGFRHLWTYWNTPFYKKSN